MNKVFYILSSSHIPKPVLQGSSELIFRFSEQKFVDNYFQDTINLFLKVKTKKRVKRILAKFVCFELAEFM